MHWFDFTCFSPKSRMYGCYAGDHARAQFRPVGQEVARSHFASGFWCAEVCRCWHSFRMGRLKEKVRSSQGGMARAEAKQFEPLQIEYHGACTPQQLEQSCLEIADWSRVQFVLLQLQTFCHSGAFSFWVSTCQWLLLSLVVSDMALWFPKLGELTTVGWGHGCAEGNLPTSSLLGGEAAWCSQAPS